MPTEEPIENNNDSKSTPDLTIPNEISANSLETPESTTDSSSGQYTLSRYSASLSEGNTSSPPTSLSVDLSSPFDYDELISVPSMNMGNEYFYADGKSSTYNPDQDRTPVKSDDLLTRNGSIDSGFSLERNISVSTRGHPPQLIGPGSVLQSAWQPRLNNNRLRRSRGTSDSEDCFYTYSMFQRRYGS